MKTLLIIAVTIAVISTLVVIILLSISEKDKTSTKEKNIIPNWVAFGEDTDPYNNIIYSADGITWQKTTTGVSFRYRAWNGAYGTSNGTSPLWVAAGDSVDGNGSPFENILFSSDGISWQESDNLGANFATEARDIAYGTSDGTNHLWVAVGNNNNTGAGTILYSDNGKFWNNTISGSCFFSSGIGVAHGTSDGTSPLWVAAGDGDPVTNFNNMMWSENGKTWTATTQGDSFSGFGRKVAYGTSNGSSPFWVAVGIETDNGGYNNMMWSENGKIWTKPIAGASFSHEGWDVAYGTSNGTSPLWVAVGNNTNDGGDKYGNILYSENGKEWQQSSSEGEAMETEVLGIAYKSYNGSPVWVAVGEGGSGYKNILYSYNGKVWNNPTEGDSFNVVGNGVISNN